MGDFERGALFDGDGDAGFRGQVDDGRVGGDVERCTIFIGRLATL
jgi:hypothetical protein